MNNNSKNILDKYPNKIPIIIKLQQNSKLKLDKYKYIVPDNFTICYFQMYIRNKMQLESDKAIFMIIDNKLMKQSMLLSQVYELYKDTDGFLYVTISEESVFG
jgi:GABA(A) receptor-associated protein